LEAEAAAAEAAAVDAAEAEAVASQQQKLRNKANKAREKEEAAMDQAMEKAREAGLEPEGWILSRLTQCLIAALPIAPIAVPRPLRSATKRMQTATS
jgi:hypothetical protein